MAFSRPSKYSLRDIFNQLFNDRTNTLTLGTSPTPPTTSVSGKKVTSGTTAVQLVASATPARRVTIQAFATNTGVIAIGGSNVVAASDATATGIQLNAGDAYELNIDDVSKV